MIPLYLTRKSTARWHSVRRWLWRCAVLFLMLMFVPAAAAFAGEPIEMAQDILPLHPRQLEPPNHSYVSTTAVTFRWTPTAGASQYRLLISQEGDEGGLQIWADGSTTSVTYVGLEPGYSYRWRVDVDVTTAGPHWDEFEFTLSETVIAPGSAAEIEASDGSYDDRILVHWSHAFRASHYLLQRREQGSAQFSDLTIVGEEREYIDERLPEDKHYEYRVLACNSAGCSAPSVVDAGWVGACSILSPPELVSPLDGADVVFYWQYPYYNLTWEQVPGAAGYWLKVWNTETNEVIVDELRDGPESVDYEIVGEGGYMAWNVTAVHPVTGCPSSPPSEVWTFHAYQHPPPAVPVNVQASDGAYPDRVRITWEQPPSDSELESWQIWRATEPDVETATEIAARYGDNPEHLDEDVVPGTIYYYWIEACSHADGCSEKSAPDSGFATDALPILDYSIYIPQIAR